ncbi:MAG: hypothetical protein ACI9MC_001183 [Kiritimatiellia bacterium]|jgi:hypothetical protein
MTKAGALPPIDTWDPQVHAWMYSAWSETSDDESDGRIGVPDLVRALWSAGDPWSRAYRHLFAGAGDPSTRPLNGVPDDIYYSANEQVIDLFHRAADLGDARVTPWALLCIIATLTSKSASRGALGARGIWTAPVLALRPGGKILLQRRLDEPRALELAGTRQLVAVLPDEEINSKSDQFATPYVDGHFHMLLGDSWVLREPTSNAPFWVLQGLVPDAWSTVTEALRETQRRVPGFLPWMPVQERLSEPSRVARLRAVLDALRPLQDVIMGSVSPRDEREPWDHPTAGVDTLFVALDHLTGLDASTTVAPIANDRAGAPDALGRNKLANTLASSLALRESTGALTVALLGPTGSGRSTLLRQIATAWTAGLPSASSDVHERCHDRLSHIHIDATLCGSDPRFAAWAAVMEGLGARRPTPPPCPTDEPNDLSDEPSVDILAQAVRMLLPGAGGTSHHPGAKRLGVAGTILGICGLAGLWALAPGPLALIPAVIAALGGTLAATAIGKGVVGPTFADDSVADFFEEDEPAQTAQRTLQHKRRAIANQVEHSPSDRVLVTIDDLDRCSPVRARHIVETVYELIIENPELTQHNPFVVAFCAQPELLATITPPGCPPQTLVQVPLWLEPLDRDSFELAVSAWTGAAFPRNTRRTRPKLVTNTNSTPTPAVPISVGLAEVGLVTAGDLAWFRAYFPLSPRSPRRLKALVNQFRLCRSLLPADGLASDALFWLILADQSPHLARTLAEHLRHTTNDEPVDSCLHTIALRSGSPASGWPRVQLALRHIAKDAMPTTAGLRATANTSLRWTHAGPAWAIDIDPTPRALRKAG